MVCELSAEKVKLDNPDLNTTEPSPCKRAAMNMRTLLKKKWPGTKFTVRLSRFSGGNSVDVKWMDGPASADVKKVCDVFESGYFDGMTDSYVYCESNWRQFGETKYLSVNRGLSEERSKELENLLQDAANKLPERDGGCLQKVGETEFLLGRAQNGGFSLWNDGWLAEAWTVADLVWSMAEKQDKKGATE